MAIRKDSPQKAAMRDIMRDYLKNNDIRDVYKRQYQETGMGSLNQS